MDKNINSRGAAKKQNISIAKILRRPIVRLALLIIIVILAVVIIKNCATSNKGDTELVGYQKLINATDNKYTFINLNGKIKTYDGYTSMDDFYYDVTCVSKVDNDSGVTKMALINKNNKEIVKYGTYDNFTQVVGGKFYKVEKDGMYGIIDCKGKVVINPEYNYISITTVQEATEVVFECQKDATYSFVNENGKKFYETDVALHSISYANKFNSDYDTIIYISLDGQKKYFDLVTGEELFSDVEDVNVSYNILSSDGNISFYDKNGKLKTELDTSEDYSSDTRVYFKKYVVVEQKNVTTGTRQYKYTVYDSNFKKILESENKITPVQDIDENVYFIINETDGVRIINENKKEVKVEGYEFNGNNINKLQYLVLNPKDDVSSYEVYTFKGKKVKDGIVEYLQKGFGLVTKSYDENGNSNRSLILAKNKEIELSSEDTVLATDYYLTIENSKDNVVSVVDKDGNIKVDKATGTKLFYVENYIGIQNDDVVNIYDVDTGKITFTYALTNYINRDETVNVIELSTGYYTFGGKTVLEK
jgi:hypothetical protein